MIQVRVKFFSAHKEAVGKSELLLELPEGTTLNRLLEQLEDKYPKLRELHEFTIVVLNHEATQGTEILKDQDTVVLFPPVAGG